jgi:hypothetical protein
VAAPVRVFGPTGPEQLVNPTANKAAAKTVILVFMMMLVVRDGLGGFSDERVDVTAQRFFET